VAVLASGRGLSPLIGHPELASPSDDCIPKSIVPFSASVKADKWMLEQVQHDDELIVMCLPAEAPKGSEGWWSLGESNP